MATKDDLEVDGTSSAVVPMRRNPSLARTDIVLWSLVAGFVAINLVLPFLGLPSFVFSLIFLLLGGTFIVIHGKDAYGVKTFLVFIGLALFISNLLENTSILTGFPFGHYHYSEVLGPRIFLVPILIGPAYLAVGYLSWTLAG